MCFCLLCPLCDTYVRTGYHMIFWMISNRYQYHVSPPISCRYTATSVMLYDNLSVFSRWYLGTSMVCCTCGTFYFLVCFLATCRCWVGQGCDPTATKNLAYIRSYRCTDPTARLICPKWCRWTCICFIYYPYMGIWSIRCVECFVFLTINRIFYPAAPAALCVLLL